MAGFGADNTKVQVILPKELYAAIEDLAEKSDLTVSHYIRRVLGEATAQRCFYPSSSSTKFGFVNIATDPSLGISALDPANLPAPKSPAATKPQKAGSARPARALPKPEATG